MTAPCQDNFTLISLEVDRDSRATIASVRPYSSIRGGCDARGITGWVDECALEDCEIAGYLSTSPIRISLHSRVLWDRLSIYVQTVSEPFLGTGCWIGVEFGAVVGGEVVKSVLSALCRIPFDR